MKTNVMIELDNGERTPCLLNGAGTIVIDPTTNRPKIRKDYIGTAAPTVNDDVDAGYSVGSEWIDTDASAGARFFKCVDVSEGAAVWVNCEDT
jgi:hypothetical protein